MISLADQDQAARRQIRCLGRDLNRLHYEQVTPLRYEYGIGSVDAAHLAGLCDPFRFTSESELTRWSGNGSRRALSRRGQCFAREAPRLDFGGIPRTIRMVCVANVNPGPNLGDAHTFIDDKLAESKSSDACGRTSHDARSHPITRLDT